MSYLKNLRLAIETCSGNNCDIENIAAAFYCGGMKGQTRREGMKPEKLKSFLIKAIRRNVENRIGKARL